MLVACVSTGSILELVRFPDRQVWLFALDAVTALIAVGTLAVVRHKPARSLATGVVAVNLLGVTIGSYHALVGAPVTIPIWTLTGLLCTTALFLGWGWRAQVLASFGALIGYCLQLPGTDAETMSWLAGCVYLGWVVGLSVVCAELIARHLKAQFELVAQLTERESRLQSYFDLSLVGTAIVARDRGLLEVNSELCRILGRASDALLGSTWSELVPDHDRSLDTSLFRQVIDGELAAGRREGALLRPDGAPIHASISVRALPGPLGHADHLIVVVQDMTDRRRAEQEREQALLREQKARHDAEAASRAKDEFLAVVSHELRTPLTSICGWTPLLREGQLDAEQQRRALEAIERGGRSLVQLIDDLLDVSRIVSGKLRLAVQRAEMGPILQAAVESMRLAANAKNVRLQLQLPAQPEYVLGDPDRLQQVVWNLVANAIKFTPAEGRVTVELMRDNQELVVRVSDNGRGIDPELLPHVFERFWQADATTTRRHGGLGLGLAIVRHLVELHGGTVSAESAVASRGAVFTVRLPASTAAAARSETARRISNAAADALQGLRVLVIDDETDSQEVARLALEIYGVEVRTAGNVQQGLAIVDNWQPTVVVSDIAMPDEDGYALIRHLRSRDRVVGGRLPALAFSALARAEDRSRALAAGFDGYLAKPIDMHELLDAVAAVAGRAPAADHRAS